MSVYIIATIVVLMVLFIVLTLLPFIDPSDDMEADDFSDPRLDQPPSWAVIHRH
jgi:hypothetical protein